MAYVNVGSAKDLPSGKMMEVELEGKKILVANLAGKYYSIGSVCTHRGCNLSKGKLDKGKWSVECPCHGSIFDIKTGKVLHGPASKPEPEYKVKVDGNQILVEV